MYLFVFTSRTSFLLAFVLLLSILLQPVKAVLADTSPPVIPTEIEIIDDVTPANSEAVIDIVEGSVSTPPDAETSLIEPLENPTDSASEEVNDLEILVESTPTNSSTTEDVPVEDITLIDSDSLSLAASSSTTTVPSQADLPVTAVSYSDSVVQFDKDSCVSVSDGSFYCQSKAAEDSVRADGVYAFPDKDGDLEIFVQLDKELTQLTFNTDDDSSPYFDSESNTMVWHRLINDRYQIISYDVETGTETQLTDDSVNNMEPTRSGKFTVWQHWDNNWEVVLFDGSSKHQLSHSVEHDVSPSIRNGLVVWYKLTDGADKSIQLYNIKTKEFTVIEDTDGGTISNPRMVVVYETTYENGDVVTKGYDLATGEIISLDAVPVELPDTLPNPDATGETRALLQVKVSTKEDGDGELTSPTSLPPPPPTIGEFDLVIEVGATSTDIDQMSMPIATTTEQVIISDYTLDLSVPEVSQNNVAFEIEDVVVQPFSSSTNN